VRNAIKKGGRVLDCHLELSDFRGIPNGGFLLEFDRIKKGGWILRLPEGARSGKV
jgi:hypothetical protein